MSCNCHNYTPCDPICPQCSGTTTSSSTTTTTTCSGDIVCTDYWKDICVEHSGDSCYQIPAGTNLNSILMHLLSFVPPTPGCTTTSTTTLAPTTTTTTHILTTTTTTCICPPTTTTTSTSTTTTTTLRPCDCETYSLKNVSNITQSYSYTNCSRARFIDIPLAAGATVLICVCDEDLTYNNNFILALALGTGCNTSTTTSTSTTSTTSSTSTTTTTTASPVCQQYRVQSTALPASWSAQTCYGEPVSGSFSSIGQSLYTGCILSTTLVLTNAIVKEILSCPSTTTSTTSTTSTSTSTSTSSTTTTTTQSCRRYAIYSEAGGYATADLCDNGLTTFIGVAAGQTILSPCVIVGSVINNGTTILYDLGCDETTTTSTSTTSTSTTSTSTTSTSTTTTSTSTTTISPQSDWTIRNADCGGGTINGVSINGSSIPSLTGNDFPLTSTQSGTASNPSGINYGGSNTIQANVTTNIAGSGNCAVMYIFINDLFNPAHTLFFTSNPFPQISGVVINGGDVVEVQIACLTGPCPETTTTTIEPTTTSTTSTTSTSTTSTTLEPTTTTSTSTSTSTTTTTTVEPTTTTSTSTTTTVEPPSTTTTTTVEETYAYYNVTQFLNCIQNSAPGGFVMRVPTALDTGATWWCGDDGFQYQFDSNTSGPSYNITAVDVAISCGSLSC